MTARISPPLSPSFKGLWLPICILADQELTLIQKVILAEVSALQGEAGCFASNAHFCALVGGKERNLRNHFSTLIGSGLLRAENATSTRRRLFVWEGITRASKANQQEPVSRLLKQERGGSD
jgi:hypothetical protein